MAEGFVRHKQPWTTDEVQKLHRLAAKGMALKAIGKALHGFGFDKVAEVRQGKYFELALDPSLKREDAEASVRQMCDKLLANTVVEDYQVEIVG